MNRLINSTPLRTNAAATASALGRHPAEEHLAAAQQIDPHSNAREFSLDQTSE
jgi:hypothetical protein